MTNTYNRFVAGMLAAGMFFSSVAFVSAENVSSSDVAALTAQVQNLLAQVAVLQAQLAITQKEVSSAKQELALTRALAFGSKGQDVSDLQEFLKNFPDIYPEGLITGFFGHATENAVKRLQKKHGLENAGIVGPRTREKLHKLFSEHRGKGKGGFFIKHKDDNDGDDDRGHVFASSTIGLTKIVICHKPEHKHGGETITIAAPALLAHLRHGDMFGACGSLGGAGTTTPDIIAPVISNIVSHPTTIASEIAWDTNEAASYKFWYGTTTPLVPGTPDKTGSAALHQTVSLSALSSGTTYYYLIAATDASGNTGTSTQQSFTTVVPDTTAPIISNISASAIPAGGNTAILWNTNENADSVVWYGLTNPLDIASTTATTKAVNATLSMSHSVPLSGLTASTTYFYIVGSQDAFGNQTTSSQASFTTL